MKFRFILHIILPVFLSFHLSLAAQTVDAKKIAKYIQASVENANPSYLNSLFHYNSFAAKFVDNDVRLYDFNKQFHAQASNSIDPGSLISAQMSPGSSYQLINITAEGKKYTYTFRVNSESGLDYHKYFLEEIDNELRVVDIYMYYEDILLSNKVASVYNILCKVEQAELFTTQEIKSQESLNNYRDKFREYLVEGKTDKILKQYSKLDDSYKTDRDILMIALRAASNTDLKETMSLYQKTKDFEHGYGANLIVLEGLYTQEAYQEILTYIDRVDRSVGSDPYLNYLRASVFKATGKNQKAEWLLNKTIQELPNEQSAYFSLLEIYLESSRFTDASKLLDTLSSTFGFYKEELAPLLIAYPGYIESDEYTTWIESL